MSERVAVIKDKWLACAICWVALVLVLAVSWWVYGTRGANPFGGALYIAIFFIPVTAGASFLFERRELRLRSSLPRSFRKRRHWSGPRDMGWWVFVGLAVAWSIGGMLWVPDSGTVYGGMMLLIIQLGEALGHIAFLSTRDESA